MSLGLSAEILESINSPSRLQHYNTFTRTGVGKLGWVRITPLYSCCFSPWCISVAIWKARRLPSCCSHENLRFCWLGIYGNIIFTVSVLVEVAPGSSCLYVGSVPFHLRSLMLQTHLLCLLTRCISRIKVCFGYVMLIDFLSENVSQNQWVSFISVGCIW